MSRTERIAMLISTMNDVPGYKVTSVLGEVFGSPSGRATSDPSSAPPSNPWPEASSKA
jgi:hypothetical protein